MLSSHEKLLHKHKQLIAALYHDVAALTQRLEQRAPPLPSGGSASTTAVPTSIDSPMCDPEPFDADLECHLIFSQGAHVPLQRCKD